MTIYQKEIMEGLHNRDNLDLRVKWIGNLRSVVSRRMPRNRTGASLITDIDLVLAYEEEREEALEKTLK